MIWSGKGRHSTVPFNDLYSFSAVTTMWNELSSDVKIGDEDDAPVQRCVCFIVISNILGKINSCPCSRSFKIYFCSTWDNELFFVIVQDHSNYILSVLKNPVVLCHRPRSYTVRSNPFAEWSRSQPVLRHCIERKTQVL